MRHNVIAAGRPAGVEGEVPGHRGREVVRALGTVRVPAEELVALARRVRRALDALAVAHGPDGDVRAV